MPVTYNLREQPASSSSSSSLAGLTSSTYSARSSRDPRIHEPADDIVLSDLVRGTGEASRLRRRGALLHRGDRVVDRSDRSSTDHHQSTSSPGMSHYPLNVHQRHIQPQLPNTPGDGVLGPLASQDGVQSSFTARPLRWSIFAPYEDESTTSTSTSISALPSQSQPQMQHSRFIIGPQQLHYPQRQPQQSQPQPQQPPLVLPFPVTPPLDLGTTRGVGSRETNFNEYTYVLRCGGNESDDDGLCEPVVSAQSSSTPFVPSILPLFPSRPQQQASTPSTSSTRTQKRSSNGCGTIIHYNAAPLSKIRTWTARTEATDDVVHLDSCYFDSPIVGKIVPSTCGCVREGVGCAVCGNPLGTLYVPCKTAIDLSSRTPRPSSSSQSSTPPKLHIYSFFPFAVSSSPSYSFPSPSSPSSPSLSPMPSSPTSSTTSSSFTSTRRSSHPFLTRSRSSSRSRSRSRSPSPTRPAPRFLSSSTASAPLQVVVPGSTPISGHTHAPFPPYSYAPHSPYSGYPSYPHRPHTSYGAFNGRPTSAQSHFGPARSDSFPMALHTPLPHVHPYVQPPHTHLSHLHSYFLSRSHSNEDGRNEDDSGLGHEHNRGGESEREQGLQRPIPTRRMEQLPPPIPITRTYSTLGVGGGGATTTGFFFGRTATASPIPLSDDDDDDDDDENDDELDEHSVNDLHGAGARDLADDEKEDEP